MEKGEADKIKGVIKDALGFVFARQKKEGGFSLTPELPATLEDTYYAFKILEVAKGLDIKITNFYIDAHKLYLISKLKTIQQLNKKSAYQLLFCLNFIGEKILNPFTKIKEEVLSLEDAFYFLKCSELLEQKLKLNIVEYGFIGIIKKRFMSLYLDRAFKANKIQDKLAADWISSCQNPDGGFGFLPGTTSFIENTFWAIKALKLLKTPLEQMDITKCYIFSCKTKGGGFSRKAGAAPFLDATFYAVVSIYNLMENTG